MLSFDITDRNIRIIKGTESNGKIKISAAATLNLDEAIIVNGHVNDINRVAMMINQVLKQNNMFDKEAIVSISSNQTVFKELLISPTAKESEFMKNIRHELQMQINIDDSYSVGYLVVGDPEETETGERMQKVLATACPYDVVDCYKRVFSMMGISLKTVMIGCNAITKVLLADVKVKSLMPLLAVQIDSNFISLNLYENNQLSFSRFASIDPDDYDDPDDYVFEAVNENIFRMLQFARSRGGDSIDNVVFYGDITVSPNLYNRLVDEMANNDISVSQLNVPPQIHGYQNLEFSVYANAVGAMFKRNKVTEHVNLLEADGSVSAMIRKKNNQSGGTALLIVGLIVSLVAVLGTYGVVFLMNEKVVNDTKKLQAQIDSPETAAKRQQYQDLRVLRQKVATYKTLVTNSSEAYKSQPVLSADNITTIEDAVTKVMEQIDGAAEAEIVDFKFEEGVITVPVQIRTSDEFSQKYPTALVKNLEDQKKFEHVYYESYEVTEAEKDEAGRRFTPRGKVIEGVGPDDVVNYVNFDLMLVLKSDQNPDLEAKTQEETAE
ncbi:MAG: pilus assembly protein PilM [Oscillospiraceae bacterium]|nr:pilus assembly protein PilM [Oscillospiraceae bacterium]